MRILIINPFGIGDVLFTTPLIANLKEAMPDSYIGFVCNARAKDILLSNPKVDKVFIYEKDKFRKLWKVSRIMGFRKFVKFLGSIRKKQFDCVIDLSLGREFGFFSWLIGIKKRIGYNYKNRGIFLTDKIKIAGYEKRHIVSYYLDILKLLGIEPRPKGLEFPLDQEDVKWANAYLSENGIGENDMLIGLIPGGGASWGVDAYKKQWPAHRFARLANLISDKIRPRLILFGDMSEIALCNQIASLIRQEPILACGRTTLSRFAALIKRCGLVICNDGGPLHIAVSQGVKTVAIFGPVDPEVYGPYPKDANSLVIKKDLVCQPCYQRFKLKSCAHDECLTALETKEIMAAIDNFLGGETGGA
ncbi:MAG: glycosyltransferase family 9 protein [Candidatus Omnitrophica bacterium]|nr:glycosyltransferase family 9 protein [Candidatus Omnitrophota bacterium]